MFKQLVCGTALAGLLVSVGRAHVLQTNLAPTNGPIGISSSDYAITENGANHQVWQQVTTLTNARSKVSYQTNSFTELATGLNHLVGNNWVPSTEDIQPTEQGGAATNAQHQVYFAGNLNTVGAIDLVMSNGQQLQSRIVALDYYDSSIGSNVVFAIPQDRIGQIVSNNQVVYTNAFNGCTADVRYTFTRLGLEQDVVLQQQPPDPAALGLNPATSSLRVWTQFTNSPAPQVTQLPDGDQYLDFGPMQMGSGRAFLMGDDTNSVPVHKHWVSVEGHTYLLEEVQLSDIAEQLQSLPSGGGRSASLQIRGFPKVQPPPPRMAGPGTGGLKVAKTHVPDKGLVLDYQAVSSTSGMVFQGDTTYYVSGAVTLSGTTTLEGGAVVKFTNGTSVGITLNGALVSTAGPYRPAVFTSKNDDSVGLSITGSTGSPANTGATYLIGSSNQTNDYKYLRFLYAATGVSNASTAATVWHSQFVNCGTAVAAGSGANITLRNVLITVGTNCVYTSGSVAAEHLTADQMQHFCAISYGGAHVTNSIIAGVTSQTGVTAVSSVTSGSGLFQTALAGNYYLTNGSTNRDAGSTNINSTLASNLMAMTTYPPVVLTNSFSANTSLSPQAFRDTDTPDLGYHYDSLDYVWDNPSGSYGINGSVTLTLNSGTAFGFTGEGIVVADGSTLVSTGSPTNLNHLTGVCMVQEQPANFIQAYIYSTATGSGSSLQLQFTDIPAMGGNGTLFPDPITLANSLSALNAWGCTLRGVSFTIEPVNYTAFDAPCVTPTCTAVMNNNLLERCAVSFARADVYDDDSGSAYEPLTVTLGNNLFYGGSLSVNFNNTTWDSSGCSFTTLSPEPAWSILNNVFDGASVSTSGTGLANVTADYNAYAPVLGTLGGTHNLNNVSTTYASGPLGPWYQSATNYINRGSTTADQVGLYHYTTQTNQTKETNSTVDIGFHYVALDANGNPMDSNSDGIPDYLADSNGNGTFDSGVDLAAWASGTTNSDSTGAVKLTVYTPLK